MSRLRIYKIVQQHSVNLTATHLDTKHTKHHNIELHILAYLCNRLILKYQT